MFRSVPTAGRIVLTVFHNVYGVVLLEFISKGTTINSEGYCRTSQSRTHEFEVCPHMVQPLLQHDSAQQHTSATGEIGHLGSTVVDHSS